MLAKITAKPATYPSAAAAAPRHMTPKATTPMRKPIEHLRFLACHTLLLVYSSQNYTRH